ncbi:Gfo/Idh/MocA family protein [Microbacterium marinilacus]|uniref:Gfo/Idh/MocA family oxidoreductase n=1 Tax=Microbacterium marinilacus TaxID=415209 RepID=A0ABP7B706_9MICO|nr:Gfo/Idh/MocA family oxidoreductase [Microbacterium marinilacus]
MNAPIRTAVVGFGVAGRWFHAAFLATDPAYRLDAIVSSDAERAAAAHAEHPGASVFADLDELWRRADDLDLVVVAAPSHRHRALAERALDHGLHVVVDKPLVADPADGEALIARAHEHGRVLTVFHNRRWDGDFLTVQELIDGGRLGEVRRFESRFEWWQPEAPEGWKSQTAAADGGGILFDLGPHVIDQALRLFGPARCAHAELATRRAGAAADDDAFVALEHDSGVISHLWMSAVASAPGPRFRAVGSDATFTSWGLDGQEAALLAGARPGDPGFGETPPERWGTLTRGDRSEPVPMRSGGYGAFYARLAEAIRGAAPPVDPRDAVAGLRIIAAARRRATQRPGTRHHNPERDDATPHGTAHRNTDSNTEEVGERHA